MNSNKILILISPPRSLSVAFTRMIQARDDFIIFHEPSQRAYDDKYYADYTKDWWRSDSYKTFDEVKKAILDASHLKNVFVKEMSFVVQEYYYDQSFIETFIKQSNVIFIFLIRQPHAVINSFYKKCSEVGEVDKTIGFEDLIGYKYTYNLYQFIKENSVNKPIIIKTEDLYNYPEKTLKDFCEKTDIFFIEKSLKWDNLGENFTGEEQWHEIKRKEITHHWHSDAIYSSGFSKPHEYKVNINGIPTFEEIPEKDRELCFKVYKENLTYYNLLLKN